MNSQTISLLFWDLFIPYFVICVMFYIFLASGHLNRSVSPRKSVLFVTAHPDDECMFFSPTLSALVRNGNPVYLLCLSTGNFYNKGKVRKKELLKSCEVFGIPESQVTTIEHVSLQDDPKVHWDLTECGKVVLDHVNIVHPDVIITFDSMGVSGHYNHRSIYFTLEKLIKEDRLPEETSVYYLESVSLPRQYASLLLLDLPYSFLSADLTVVAPWWDLLKGQKACLSHWSQMEWFRLLHLSFSRYMVINSFNKMTINT